MSSPRHLWSGDWQLDSAAVAEELARRRARSGEPEEPEGPSPEPPRPPRKPSASERFLAALRELRKSLGRLIAQARAAIGNARGSLSGRGRRLGVALVVVVVTLLSAGAAFAVTSLLVDSGKSSNTANAAHRLLGTGLTNAPFGPGAMITTVTPGSPAALAGLHSGDVITQINSQGIQSPSDVNAYLAGLGPGNELQVQFNRGPLLESTLVTLAARPGSP